MNAPNPEQALLGACMSGYKGIDDLTETVTAECFYNLTHGHVWRAIVAIFERGNQPDPLGVATEVAKAAPEVKVDPLDLFRMVETTPFTAHAPNYAAQVLDAAGRRKLKEAAARITRLGDLADIDVPELQDQARKILDDATDKRAVKTGITLGELLPEVVDIAERGRERVLPTGWPDLDRLVRGLAPGRLVVVGARPGVGKSVMGTNLARHFAHVHKHSVLISSLEMSQVEVGQRILAAHAGVNLTHLETGEVDSSAWDRIRTRANEVTDMPITILDDPSQTIGSIRRAARSLRKQRSDLALIVVDYLQLVRPTDTRVNRAEQVAEISRGLKLLARESGACVVAMAQVNRESTKSKDGRPTQADLRESGAIEADADMVILLHRPDFDVPEVEVIVAKNRSGLQGVCTLQMQGHYARLSNISWTSSAGVA